MEKNHVIRGKKRKGGLHFSALKCKKFGEGVFLKSGGRIEKDKGKPYSKARVQVTRNR